MNTENLFNTNMMQLDEVEQFVYKSLDVIKEVRISKVVKSGGWMPEPKFDFSVPKL